MESVSLENLSLESVSPYSILDLSPDATLPEIKNRYRQLVLMYHPDKCRNSVVLSFMSHEYFDKIQEAYKEILKTRRIADMPMEDVEYDEFHVEIDNELRSILENSENFNERFNEYFEEANKSFKELLVSKGYEEFNHRGTPMKENPMEENSIKKTPRSKTPELPRSETPVSEGSLEDVLVNSSLFSVVKKGDFSIKIPSKRSLSCSDLGKVFRSEPFKESSDPKETTEELFDAMNEERQMHQYVIPSKEEAIEIMNEKKFNEDTKYRAEKNTFMGLWDQAMTFRKRILGEESGLKK